MADNTVLERVQIRLAGTEGVDEQTDLLQELIQTTQDRIALRVGTQEFPALLASIAVDATVKLYRRLYYEGVQNEGDDGLSVSFVDDILAEYDAELEQYRNNLAEDDDGSHKRVVKFL